MKKNILFFLIILMAGCSPQKEKKQAPEACKKQEIASLNSSNLEELIDITYGKNGANLALDQIFFIQDLAHQLVNLSYDQQKIVINYVIEGLERENIDALDFKKTINRYLIKYLQACAHQKNHSTNLTESVTSSFNASEIAKKILAYMQIEQESIFNNQKSKHIFLKIIERRSHRPEAFQLPRLMNFWATTPGQQILIHYDPTNPVHIQTLEEMVIDMGVMLLTQQGLSLTNKSVTGQDAALLARISKNNQTIQTNMQSFQTSLQSNQQKKLQSMLTAFSTALKDVQKKTQQAAEISNLELNYLYKNISVDQPQQNYIFNQIQFDQLFSLGTMLTPAGRIWKNPFSVGDWEYEKTTNSFWQYQSSPISNPSTDDSGKSIMSSLQAENNAIYAEYVTSKSQYTIAGTITLYVVNFPFFAGIIFNKARWISGDFEAIRKCRMIGIYGSSSSDVGVYFAQQYSMNEKQIKANPQDDPIQTPLQQIINNKVSKQINLPASSFTNLQNSPITFNYEITNAPTQVVFKIWVGANSPTEITIDKLDPAIYMYHGIGFICPSAIAEFTIHQPQDFVFTSQAISNYKE